MHGCEFGVAVFDRITEDDFNPNVTLEVGYMLGMGRNVLLLKDKTPEKGGIILKEWIICQNMIELSDETIKRVRNLFPENEWEVVKELLTEECSDNFPMVNSDYFELAERIRFSVLKLSEGNIEKLLNVIQEAAKDWRNTLMAAGFGDDQKAHLGWQPEVNCRRTR